MISPVFISLCLIATVIAVPTIQPDSPSSDAVNSNETAAAIDMPADSHEYEELFEGDLKLSKEFILEHYNFSSIPGGEKLREKLLGKEGSKSSREKIERRGAGKVGSIDIWSNGAVNYVISNDVPQATCDLIRLAVKHWEQHTCVRFTETRQGDYIEFINTESGCFSRGIGRQGGRQVINLEAPGCETFGIIVHEIGHALGFYHEQSRPDRDSYVNILLSNVRSGKAHNFMKKNNNEIDSLGSTYDYGSIMHYSRTAFGTSGSTTIQVNNQAEYNSQGTPRLGQRDVLSIRDINQANALYSCPTPSSTKLRVKVRHARNLRDTDPWLNDPDPYVRVEAKHFSNSLVTRSTRDIGGTTNPTWNQWLDFGCNRWLYFHKQIWDEDSFLTFGDDEMSDKELVPTVLGDHTSQRHEAFDDGYLIYDYHVTRDLNDCSPNPCQNGGTCTDLCTSYRCSCRPGYFGTTCNIRGGNLRVYARYARDLPDEDGWWNNSDPYMEFIATDANGNTRRLTSSVRGGTQNPNWNQSLNFGQGSWRSLRVRVYDSDNNADDALSNSVTYSFSGPTVSRTNVNHRCHSGYARFDYHYTT